jgi:predicted GTPase
MTAASEPAAALCGAFDPVDRQRILGAIARCHSELDARGATVVGPLAARLRALSWRVEHGRAPRVTVVGRRGAGKSSLLNALASRELAPTGAVEDTTGAARSYTLALDEHVTVEWVDTGGLRAGGQSEARADLLRETLLDAPPDVIVFAHHASETDAGIDEDLRDVRAALEAVRAEHGVSPVLLALATRVDELDPPEVTAPPFDDETKRNNIGASVRALRRALERAALRPAEVLAINTWFSSSDDLRWNVDLLRATLLAQLPAVREERSRGELRALYGRVADALASLVARVGHGRDEPARDELRAWYVATLRRMGPSAARTGDGADGLERDRGPLRWIQRGLANAGAANIADVVEARALKSLGERVVSALFR